MEKKMNLSTKIFYGLGVSYAMIDQIFAQWVLYFYLPPASSGLKVILPPLMLSIALSITRGVDVITDPLVGYLSDKTNSKWGRRIPFIAFGTIPLALSTIALFFPIFNSINGNFWYLVITGSLFFTFYTIVGGPYNSLIPEIGRNNEERLSLSTWQSIFRLLYSAVAMITPGILIKYLGKGDTLIGIRGMVIVLSIISIIGACFTIFGIKEKKYSTFNSNSINFKSSLKILIKNKDFINYLFGLLFFFIGFNTLRVVMNYYVEDIMGYGKGTITLVSALFFGVSALFFQPTAIFSKKIGYRKVMLICLSALIILSFFMYGIGKILDIKYGFIIFGLLGIPISGAAFIFPPAMLSEIGAKISEKENVRMEGLCFGIQGFFLKMAFLVSIFFLPIILSFGNNGIVGKNGIYLSSIFSGFSFLISMFFYYRYKE